MVEYKDVCELLLRRRYKEWPVSSWEGSYTKSHWQARLDFLPLCHHNDKSFINVYLYEYDYDHRSASVEIIGASDDDVWFNLKAYSLSWDELVDNLGNIEKRLILAWKGATSNGKDNNS